MASTWGVSWGVSWGSSWGTSSAPAILQHGGWLSESQLKRHDEWRKKRKDQEQELETTIKLAYQRLTGKVTAPPVLAETKGDPEKLAAAAKKMASLLVTKSTSSAKMRTRNAQVIADLTRLASQIQALQEKQNYEMQMEEEAVVMLLLA